MRVLHIHHNSNCNNGKEGTFATEYNEVQCMRRTSCKSICNSICQNSCYSRRHSSRKRTSQGEGARATCIGRNRKNRKQFPYTEEDPATQRRSSSGDHLITTPLGKPTLLP